MIDLFYCWKCSKFSFIRRSETNISCYHCQSSEIDDIGAVQVEILSLAKQFNLDELIKLAQKAKVMFEINKTPHRKRMVGKVDLIEKGRGDISKFV